MAHSRLPDSKKTYDKQVFEDWDLHGTMIRLLYELSKWLLNFARKMQLAAFILFAFPWYILSVSKQALEAEFYSALDAEVGKVVVCPDQRFADAVADFLINQELHDEHYHPFESEYRKLLNKVCSKLEHHHQANKKLCREDDRPREFIDSKKKFITVYTQEGAPLKVPLRQGYTNTEIADCVCERIPCSYAEFLELETELEQYTHIAGIYYDLLPFIRLKDCGFYPNLVMDVGANIGAWTVAINTVYPRSAVFMIDANAEHQKSLEGLGFPFEIALVGNFTGTATFYRASSAGIASSVGTTNSPPASGPFVEGLSAGTTHTPIAGLERGTGDSLFRENTGYYTDAVGEDMSMRTLDDIAAARSLPPSQLLKLDLQGAELPALQGALERVLPGVEVVFTEANIVNYNHGAPRFIELHNFLEQHGFALYDIGELQRMRRTKQVIGMDAMFVRKTSTLWGEACTGFPSPYHT